MHFVELWHIYGNTKEMLFLIILLQVSPNHTDVFGECYIHGHEVECSKLFDKVLTNEGLCFNMNSLAATDIFRTTKYIF